MWFQQLKFSLFVFLLPALVWAQAPSDTAPTAPATICLSALDLSAHTSTDTASAETRNFLPLNYYVHQALAPFATDTRLPTFFDWKADVEIAKTWTGVQGPKMFQEILQPGLSFIDHPQLMPVDAGTVKNANGGEFVSLRADVQFKGRNIGTNVGVPLQALIDNFSKKPEDRQLVSKDSKAVIIFIHGGGTRTTGHHVPINMMNYFAARGADVISFDQGWHGEGPREFFKDSREYMEWVRAFIRQYVGKSGVPIYLAGHSMGGEFADIYRRLYPGDDLVKGVMPLSAVIDPAPGQSPEERVKAMEAFDAGTATRPDVSENDKHLLDGLITQNKISPSAGFFERGFFLNNNWAVSDEDAKRLIPALYVWGQYDWLYAGNDRTVRDRLMTIPGTTVKIYGERKNLKGQPVKIGHLIFDHFRPGTTEQEVFLDIKEFIEQTSGVKLEHQKVRKVEDSGVLTFGRVLQTYANNLAFREFTGRFVFSRKQVTSPERLAEVNQEISKLTAETTDLNQRVKTDPSLAGELAAKRAALQILKTKQATNYMPPGRNDLVSAKEEQEAANAKLKVLAKDIEAAKKQVMEAYLQVQTAESQVEEVLKNVQSPNVQKMSDAMTGLIGKMKEILTRIDKATDAYYLESIRNGTPINGIPDNIATLHTSYELMAVEYQSEISALSDEIRKEALQGLLGDVVRAAYESFEMAKAQYQTADAQVRELEQKISSERELDVSLMRRLVGPMSDGLFTSQDIRVADMLNQSYSQLKSNMPVIQGTWSSWSTLWRGRPQNGATSLY